HALYWLGGAAQVSGNLDEADRLGKECLSVSEEVGDLWMISCASVFLRGGVALARKELSEAIKWRQRGLRVFQGLELEWGIATTHELLGDIAYMLQQYQEAWFHFHQALKRRSDVGSAWETMWTLSRIAKLFAAEGSREMTVELLALILEHPASHEGDKE